MEQNSLLDQLKKATENKLGGDFVIELLKCCFNSQKVFDICKQHLKFHYLQNEAQKKIVQFMYDKHDVTGTVPTIGVIGQSFINDREVIALLAQIKKIDIPKDVTEPLLKEFEQFIKKSRFIALYSKAGELFNQGKQDEATEVLAKESAEIVAFELKEAFYTTVFKDFDKRNADRLSKADKIITEKCMWGIHELDDITRGGIVKGTSALILARSGAGKSTMLRWIGLSNARQGKRVVHFQIEGSEREVLDAYDAGWTATQLDKMELGALAPEKKAAIQKTHRNIKATGGEIYVYASETFDSMSIEDCREILVDIQKIHGAIDLILFDYLEILQLKGLYYNSDSGERKKREDIANKLTNIAVEFNAAVVTATQANDINPENLKKPDFVMTRHNVSECKGIVKPFSYFVTLNATPDEYENEILRIHVDKLRKGKLPKEPVRIYQSRSNSRFYDSAKTIETFYNKVAA